MTAWNKGKRKYSREEVFCEKSDISQSRLRLYYLQENVEYKCVICNLTKWLNEDLNLELDHENGDNRDNRLFNLRWLCPNCHSQTPTFKGNNNITSGKRKVDDARIIEAFKDSVNITEVLLKVGLRPRGANYDRIYRLMIKNNLAFPDKKNYCIDCQSEIDNGTKRCKKCFFLSKRKIKERPSIDVLLKQIDEFGYVGTGKLYGVSDNAIRKWLK